MIENLIALIDESKTGTWRALYPQARDCAEPITRINAMYLLFCAAYDVLGKEYAMLRQRWPGVNELSWHAMHAAMGDSVWDEVYGPAEAPLAEPYFKYELYDGKQEEDIDFNWDGIINKNIDDFKRGTASYFFSFGQTSCNGHTLFDYDSASNSMRAIDTLTMREALLSLIRLYHVVDPYETESKFVPVESIETASYRKDIITDELLQRAQYLPTPTTEVLPYYTGLQQDWVNEGSFLSEASFRLYADQGMNFIRVCLTCKNFFGVGDEVTDPSQVCAYVGDDGETYYAIGKNAEDAKAGMATAVTEVDLACLTKLDEVISWGLKYGIHVCVQFVDFPGHIQYLLPTGSTADSDFFVSDVKQAQTVTLLAVCLGCQ